VRRKSVLSLLAPAALLLQVSAASAAVCGDAYYNHPIDWPSTSALYYTVAGAPPNTCGHLYANRNGSGYVLNAANWICTDSFGNATKGPWSSNPDDETAFVYIDWGTCTSPIRKHIWDVGAPAATVTATVPNFFYGNATDEAWGAGFDPSWSPCWTTFRNDTTALYWSDDTSSYSAVSADFVRCSISGTPSLSVFWNQSTIPDGPDHVSGNSYTWTVWVSDGGQWAIKSKSFTY
jgi:hypothetical protein